MLSILFLIKHNGFAVKIYLKSIGYFPCLVLKLFALLVFMRTFKNCIVALWYPSIGSKYYDKMKQHHLYISLII